MSDLIKLLATSISAGLLILFFIIYTSDMLFGDITLEDNYKPLWVIIPVMGAVITWLIIKTNKK